MRDLKKDLEICEAATPGPWKWITKGNTVQSRAVTTDTGKCGIQKTICASISTKSNDAQFIASAREGWPEAIQRAIAAEEENVKLAAEVTALQKVIEAARDATEEWYIKAALVKDGHEYFAQDIENAVIKMAKALAELEGNA